MIKGKQKCFVSNIALYTYIFCCLFLIRQRKEKYNTKKSVVGIFDDHEIIRKKKKEIRINFKKSLNDDAIISNVDRIDSA